MTLEKQDKLLDRIEMLVLRSLIFVLIVCGAYVIYLSVLEVFADRQYVVTHFDVDPPKVYLARQIERHSGGELSFREIGTDREVTIQGKYLCEEKK